MQSSSPNSTATSLAWANTLDSLIKATAGSVKSPSPVVRHSAGRTWSRLAHRAMARRGQWLPAHRLVGREIPKPRFAGLETAHDGMSGVCGVLTGVPGRGGVATADVPARGTACAGETTIPVRPNIPHIPSLSALLTGQSCCLRPLLSSPPQRWAEQPPRGQWSAAGQTRAAPPSTLPRSRSLSA